MTEWKRQQVFVIPNTDEDHVLLLPTDDGKWTPPSFDAEEVFVDLHLLQRRLRQDFQANMSVLRWIHRRRLEIEDTVYRWDVALMENHNPDWQIPAGAKFYDAQALQTLPLAEEWQREVLLNAFTNLKEQASPLRPPWYEKGWFQKAKKWVQSHLDEQGYERLSEIEQYKHWSLSALLRVETNKGRVFFKISNKFPLFAHEPKIMEKLSQVFPKFVPPPLAVENDARWMLMEDYGTMAFESEPSKELFARLAQDYAKLQQSTSSPEMHKTLEESGCFNRRLAILESQIASVFLDEKSYASLEAEEMLAWKASQPKLIALCQALGNYNIPNTLVHGDFHAGNVAFRGDEVLIFDWTDACISHPFFDIPVYLDYNEGDADELRKAYLSEWLAYEPMERLEEAYLLAELGAMLHQLVSYQGIHNGVEADQKADWERAVIYYVRKLLKAIPTVNL
jgi:aminoglycoside/choline kinase family phosphotransferase